MLSFFAPATAYHEAAIEIHRRKRLFALGYRSGKMARQLLSSEHPAGVPYFGRQFAFE
jgi:hypothetical protein